MKIVLMALIATTAFSTVQAQSVLGNGSIGSANVATPSSQRTRTLIRQFNFKPARSLVQIIDRSVKEDPPGYNVSAFRALQDHRPLIYTIIEDRERGVVTLRTGSPNLTFDKASGNIEFNDGASKVVCARFNIKNDNVAANTDETGLCSIHLELESMDRNGNALVNLFIDTI